MIVAGRDAPSRNEKAEAVCSSMYTGGPSIEDAFEIPRPAHAMTRESAHRAAGELDVPFVTIPAARSVEHPPGARRPPGSRALDDVAAQAPGRARHTRRASTI